MISLRVLIIEDDALIAMLLADTVIGLGHRVCAIEATEANAVAAAARFQPDMMIVDAGLSEGNGVSAVTTILRAGFIPHIFVTGDPVEVKALMPGAVVLQKPFFEPELVRAIALALPPAIAS
jgi:CheY-like chemotaxis protein